MTESFAELFEESVANLNLKPGTMIMGTVIDVNDDFVVVNAGLKSEGTILKEKMDYLKERLKRIFMEMSLFLLKKLEN